MTSKNVKIITFLTVLFLTVMLTGAVSAIDDTNSTISADNTQATDTIVKNVETTQITDDTQEAVANDNTITKNSDNTALKTAKPMDVGTWTVETDEDLKSDYIEEDPNAYAMVLNLVEGQTYTTSGTSVFSSETQNLCTALTINGNGAVIDGENARSFIAIGEGFTVTLNDLTIKNMVGDYGGAISNNGTLILNNVVFDSNSATYQGGAIYSQGALTATNSNFTNNQMTTHQGAGHNDYGGGAICALDELTVDGCVFDSNVAAHNDVEPKGDGGVAGAILLYNNDKAVTITNSNFTKNSGRHGGAITVETTDDATVLIKANNFVENDALYGAAIDTYNAITVTENNFTRNIVDGQGSANRVPMGAAICLNHNEGDDYTATITNNNFTENQATENGEGGAIFSMPDTELVSSENTFVNNYADDCGGAIYNQGTVTSTDDTYTGNTASYGAAVMTFDTFNSQGNTYESNEATQMAGAVYNYLGDFTSTNDKYTENTASQTGAIQNVGGEATITDCEFTENTADAVGVIFNTGELTIKTTTFTDNADERGFGDLIYTTTDVTLEDITVSADDYSNLIALRNDATVDATNVTIEGVTIADTDLETYMIANVDDYQDLYNLVEMVKTTGITYTVTANLTGTEYEEIVDESLVIDEDFLGEFIIEGNGQTIDANQMQFMTIAEDNIVTINNLTVTNAKAEKGAAIYDEGSLTVTNSVFTNNVATKYGAAIYVHKYVDAELTVSNTLFEDNTANVAAAIFANIGSTATITSSNFTNNKAVTGSETGDAGAIYANDASLTINDCKFDLNTAEVNGGAICIYNSTEVTITDSSFTSNSADENGGAIWTNGSITISNSNFTENTAVRGGAIYNHQGVLTSTGNIYENNQATQGGALFNTFTGFQEYGSVSVENDVYKQNKAIDESIAQGGAIWTNMVLTIKSSNFTENTALTGGAVYTDSAFDDYNVIIDESNFESNMATNGGAVYTNYKTSITDSNFTENNAENGGAVYIMPADMTIYFVDDYQVDVTIADSKFDSNTADKYGAAIYVTSKTTFDEADTYLNLNNVVFDSNEASLQAGAVYAIGSSDVTITDSTFTENTAADEMGGAIAGYDQSNITITGGEFTDNSAAYGGAIVTSAYLNIDDVEFNSNEATVDGGAIYIMENAIVTVEASEFTENTAVLGGAIVNLNNLTIETSEFTSNTAAKGGAIYNKGNLSVDTTTFTTNTATINPQAYGDDGYFEGGAAIQNVAGTVTVTDSTFEENNAVRFGGAINNYDGNITVTNSDFNNNQATSGAAIYNIYANIMDTNALITGSRFTENVASQTGGAIYNNDAHMTLTSNNFTDDVASSGVEIYNNKDLTMNGNILVNNNIAFDQFMANTTVTQGANNKIYTNKTISITDDNGYEITGDEIIKDVTISDRNTGDILITVNGVNTDTSQVPYSATTTDDNITFQITFDREVLNQYSNKIEITYFNIKSDATEYAELEFNLIYNYTKIAFDEPNILAYPLTDAYLTGTVTNYDETPVTAGKVTFTIGDEEYSSDVTDGTFEIQLPTDDILELNTYTVVYTDDSGNYKESEEYFTYAVVAYEGSLVLDPFCDEQGLVGDTTEFTFTLESEEGDSLDISGTLDLYVIVGDEETQVNSTTVTDGEATIGFTPDTAGVWNLVARFTNETMDELEIEYFIDDKEFTFTSTTVPVTITVEDNEGTVGQEVEITATIEDENEFPIEEPSSLVFMYKGSLDDEWTEIEEEVSYDSMTGVASVTYVFDEVDEYNVTLVLDDNKYVTDETFDATVTILPIKATIVNLGDDAITGFVNEDVTVEVQITINDEDETVLTTGTIIADEGDENLNYSEVTEETTTLYLTFNEVGVHTVTISYEDDFGIYDADAITVTVTVYEQAEIIVDEPITGEALDDIEIDFKVETDEGIVEDGTVTLKAVSEDGKPLIGVEDQVIDLSEDEPYFIISNLPAGTYYYNLSYASENYIVADNVTISVEVSPKDAVITMQEDNIIAYPDEEVIIEVSVTDLEGNPVNQGTVTITRNDDVIVGKADVEGGVAQIAYTASIDDLGDYVLTVTYDDVSYIAEDYTDAYLSVEQISIYADVEEAEGYIGMPTTITANFETGDEETLPVGVEVVFMLGDEELDRTVVDENGVATIEYIFDEADEYLVTIEFADLPAKYAVGNVTSNTVVITAIPAIIRADPMSIETLIGESVDIVITIRADIPDAEDISEGYIIVTDSQGNQIAKEAINDGMIPTLTIDTTKLGSNIYTVSYVSEGKYEAEDVTFEIVVDTIGTTIEFETIPDLTLGQTVNITVNVIADDGSVVNDGTVEFTDKEGNPICQTNIVEVADGKATITYTAGKVGSLKIFAKYSESETYSESEATAVLKIAKAATTLTIDPITAIVGQTITLTARIENENEYLPISEGKVAFKVNGKTIKDENGKVLYAKVEDGVATLEYEVPESWSTKEITISAVYSGSTNYNSSRGETVVEMSSGEPSIVITSDETFTKDTVKTFTVELKDGNTPINQGRVVFKINGKTLKDANGKVIYVDVVNGIASLNFNINATYYKTSSWTLKAVFISTENERLEATQQLQLAA